jgi:hypothetical protein
VTGVAGVTTARTISAAMRAATICAIRYPTASPVPIRPRTSAGVDHDHEDRAGGQDVYVLPLSAAAPTVKTRKNVPSAAFAAIGLLDSS